MIRAIPGTSTPSPSPGTGLDEQEQLDTFALLGIELIVALVLIFAVVALIVFALLRASRYEPRGMVVVSVSTLTIVALTGALVTGSDAIAQLAAVGLGALAGAVSELFSTRRNGHDTPNGPGPGGG